MDKEEKNKENVQEERLLVSKESLELMKQECG